MDTYFSIFAHLSVCYLHFLLAWRFFPQRRETYTVYVFWIMMGTYAVLHGLYGVSFVFELFDQEMPYLVSVLLSNWLLAVLPGFFFPIIIGELTAAPAFRTPLTNALLYVAEHARMFFHVALAASVGIIMLSIPEQFPLTEWQASPGNLYSLFMVLSLGGFWLFLLAMGLRPSSEWGALGKPLRILFGGLLLLYLLTGFADMGQLWSIVPIISTVSFSLIFSWYRFRLQFMDMILNQCISLLLLFVIVVGFASLTALPIEMESPSAELFIYTIYILFAVAAYGLITRRSRQIWRPSIKQLASVHSGLPKQLATITDAEEAKQQTTDFLARLFQCRVDIVVAGDSRPESTVTDGAESVTSVSIQGEPPMTFQLGYIRGWIPWLSEALSWIQTAGLYLQSHLQALEALAALQRQTLKSEELSTLAARAELDAMRAQIRPHFLFNTLNSIHSFIRDDPEQAEQVVEFLADLMRGVLQSSESDLIPLEQEIQLTETYLRIEKARYGNRLSFQIDFDPENDRIDVPPFSIQPLVENAIKHGVDAQLAPVDVQLTVRRDGEYVVIEVTDDGPGLADPPAGDSRPDYSRPDAAKGTGIALQNIRERLSRLYDEGASLELVIRQPHGTCARLKIPNAVSKAVND